MIKTRKAKVSKRGLYIQDQELKNTQFKIGENFKYIIDNQNKKIVIVPTDEATKNTVSKRETKTGLKPVIDLRNKEVLSLINEADYLQVEIDEDEIVVTGYEEKASNVLSKVSNTIKKVVSKTKKVVDITSLLNVKKTFDVRLSKDQLDKAVGDAYEQLTIFDVIEQTNEFTSQSVNYVKKAISKLHIPLRAISLFSGAGVMDKGFSLEDYDIVFALEKDPDAVLTYKANHDNEIYNGDIKLFDKSLFAKMNAPIMFGGSPCKGFSKANQRKGKKFLDNPDNLLVREYIKSVKANPHCQVFIMENVPQLLTCSDGQFKEEIEQELSDFEITSGVLNSKDFGDPQDRKRAILIGSKIGRIELPQPTHAKEDYKTVREAFEGLTDEIPNQKDYSQPRASTIERMKHIKQGENWRVLPSHLMNKGMLKGNTHSSVYRRLHLDKVSQTIVNIRKSLISHPLENRILSIRECARLFSLPDNFIFKGPIQSMQQQICNAVTVKMIQAVANKVKKAISNHNNSLIARSNFSLI